jgi:hypothetical protein
MRGELQTGKVSKLHDLLYYVTVFVGAYFTLKFLLPGF